MTATEIIRVRAGEGIPEGVEVVKVLSDQLEPVFGSTATERIYTVLVERTALAGVQPRRGSFLRRRRDDRP